MPRKTSRNGRTTHRGTGQSSSMTSSRSATSRHGRSPGKTAHHGMSTTAKVALATAAGAAVAATAAGLATTKKGRQITHQVGQTVHQMVDAGKRTLKSRMMRDVMETGIGTMIGAALPAKGKRIIEGAASGSDHGRGEMRSEQIGAKRSTSRRSTASRGRSRAGSSRARHR